MFLFFHTRDLDSLSGVKNNGNRESNQGRRDGGRRRRREGECGEQEKNPHFTDQFDRISGQDFGPDVVSTAGSATDPDPDDKSSEEHEHEQEEEEADPSGVNFRNADDDILPTVAVFTESGCVLYRKWWSNFLSVHQYDDNDDSGTTPVGPTATLSGV